MGRTRMNEVRKVIGYPAELAERIRKFRFAREFATEAEAVRFLIEAGLKAEEFPPKDAK